MNRSDFKSLARIRLGDAQTLLHAGRFDGAYHLFGLGIECALKACICRKTKRYDFPDLDLAKESYQHNLSKLVSAAGIENVLNSEMKADPIFMANWLIVKDWSVSSRYSLAGQAKASAIQRAIVDRRHGVMRWIRKHW